MFAEIFLATFLVAQCKVYVGAMNLEDIVHPGYNYPKDEDSVTVKDEASSELTAEWINELLDETDGFLAGESTPVWTAYRGNLSTRVIYTKLEKDRVKMAVDYWKSPEFKGLAIRARRDIREKVKEILSSVFEEASRPKRHNIDESGIRSVREASFDYAMKVVHPSVLIMMDYVEEWPVNKMDQEKLINERILYALAFWKGIDLQFRNIKKPKIRLRISGIIIAKNKEATPYVYDHEEARGLNMNKVYSPMMRYWQQLAKDNEDFPLKGYHIVATMTNSTPTGLPGYTYAIASSGLPCLRYGTIIDGLIFPDNLAFEGLQVAVHETAHTLGANYHDGDSDDCPAKKGFVMAKDTGLVGRNWSECTLKRISKNIQLQGSCLELPREFRPPGKPIEPILPGELTPASKQCEDRGWEDGIVCWDRLTCDKLYCRNDHWWSWCGDSGAPPVDGTTCETGKICLEGKCVSSPQAKDKSRLQKSSPQSTPELQDLNIYGVPLSVLPIQPQAHGVS